MQGISTLAAAAIALGGVLLGALITGGGAIWVAHINHRGAAERERVTTLHNAQADFAASAYSSIQTTKLSQQAPFEQVPERLAALQALTHAFMRVGLLETNDEQRQSLKGLFSIVSSRTTDAATNEGLAKAFAAVLDWVDVQAKRTDL